MGVELRPLGVACNIQCQYCYQAPQRDAAARAHYDIPAMKSAIEAEGGPFTLFGGEPLLVPLPDLEELWAWGFDRFGSNAVQTNGTLLRPEHLDLFERYNVSVGVSIDGPAELNDVRWNRNAKLTRSTTEKSLAAIQALCDRGRAPGLIVTLHKDNASTQRLPVLLDWVASLEHIGVRSINLHLLESEEAWIREQYALTDLENINALLGFLDLHNKQHTLRIPMFDEMTRLLIGDDARTTCTWYGCDPYTTSAVRGVEGTGQRSNCGRSNKDGVDFIKAATPGYERYMMLYATPQEFGGCRDCRFFLMCKGQCPGTAIDNDWRNRTEHCAVWKAIFSRLEQELVAEGQSPITISTGRSEIEQGALAAWRSRRQASLITIQKSMVVS